MRSKRGSAITRRDFNGTHEEHRYGAERMRKFAKPFSLHLEHPSRQKAEEIGPFQADPDGKR